MDIFITKYWKHPSNTNFVLIEKKISPLISIDIWFKAGTAFEGKNKVGLAHLLEHIIFKGNDTLKPGEFDLKIESLGGSSNASTGYDDVHYFVLIPPSNLKKALYLLVDLVLKPKFDLDEFLIEKEVVIEEINQSSDQADERIFNDFLQNTWGKHFYGKSILGKEKNIRNLKLHDLENFHKTNYVASNTCIAIAGDLPKDIMKIISDCKIDYPSKMELKNNQNKNKLKINTGRKKIFYKEIEFARILMAWQIPKLSEQKINLGFEILCSILSDGRNSKFKKPLLEEKDYVESIYADIIPGEFGSLFFIESCCISENLEIVENKINSILESFIKRKNITNKELVKATNIIKSNYIFNLETSAQLSAYFGGRLLWERINPISELEENLFYWSKLENIKKLLKYLSKDKFTLIVDKEKK